MKRAATLFLTLTLFCLSTAWGGGWESSGRRAKSPSHGRQVENAHYNCDIELTYSVRGGESEFFHISQEFKPSDFRSGTAEFVTPPLPGKTFLSGHRMSLSVISAGAQPEDEYVHLTLSARLPHGAQTTSQTSVTAKRSEMAVTENLSVTGPDRERLALEVRCQAVFADVARPQTRPGTISQ